ncbi:hypothetical protein G7Y89_g6722 [Cudoniella acicularis]|uniref:Alcohol dehydrogenase-like N-terminal domain-containing protein n=1 Tax=Cudoniella acicularis TaxID=354080 RepID=A0A8H4RLE6_9HELO|nr:hypothetical protein G7Y89_g6722 [Cudoniella acicularis]
MIQNDRKYISQSLDQAFTPPKTPPAGSEQKLVHHWPEPETEPEVIFSLGTPGPEPTVTSASTTESFEISHQEALLLHGPKQRYTHTREQPIPRVKNDREMLVQVEVVGLNPIDWKAPDFGFGLPTLPCISGRDLAGKVVKAPKKVSRFQVGDRIMAISTDYRDSRKSAYQQYAAVSDFNACKLPPNIASKDAAPLGVAFVAAALALGICLGMDFKVGENGPHGPDLLRIIRALNRESLPTDIRSECFDGIPESRRAKPGEWIAVWGGTIPRTLKISLANLFPKGSSATGCCAIQLAKLAGLRVIAVIDVARSGERMLKYGADLLVDRLNPQRAVSILRSITRGKLRFGLDTRGRESAEMLAQGMQFELEGIEGGAYLVGLTGLPKQPALGVSYHSVPIKVFHEAPDVGEQLMLWLEKLLQGGLLTTLDIEVAEGGLEGINAALDRLRDGSVNGPRIVVPLS